MCCDIFSIFSDTSECCAFEYFFAFLLLALAAYATKRLVIVNLNKNFTYCAANGPLEWGSLYPDALGKRQSPVNVNPSAVIVLNLEEDKRSCPLSFRNYEKFPIQYTLHNDGIKVELLAKWNNGEIPYLVGGPLGSKRYHLSSLQFRWGPNDNCGSEHTLDNKSFPLEMQLVHTSQRLPVKSEVVSCDSGESIVVVSYFFKISAWDNKFLDPIIYNLGRITCSGSKVDLHTFPLQWLAPKFQNDYFTYAGSLTEPPCTEVVIWVLRFEPTICISRRQLDYFRRIHSKDGPILKNCRPVQRLNGRCVYQYSA